MKNQYLGLYQLKVPLHHFFDFIIFTNEIAPDPFMHLNPPHADKFNGGEFGQFERFLLGDL